MSSRVAAPAAALQQQQPSAPRARGGREERRRRQSKVCGLGSIENGCAGASLTAYAEGSIENEACSLEWGAAPSTMVPFFFYGTLRNPEK